MMQIQPKTCDLDTQAQLVKIYHLEIRTVMYFVVGSQTQH